MQARGGGGLSGGCPHKRGEAGITTIEEGAIGRAPPFIETKKNVISIESFLHDAAVLVTPWCWRQMAVALKQPSRSLALRPTLLQSTALSSKSEQQVSGPSRWCEQMCRKQQNGL